MKWSSLSGDEQEGYDAGDEADGDNEVSNENEVKQDTMKHEEL